jgi:hypothetical protein
MKPIKIGKTPASAYNPERMVSSLQISQIQLLQEVVREGIKTEGQAAEYIRALNRRVQRRFPHVEPTAHGPGMRRKKKKKKKKTGAARSKRAKGAQPKRSRS